VDSERVIEGLRGEARAGVAPPARGYSYWVLGVLSLVYVFNFIDRQLLATLIQDIKADLDVSDTAMGFLSGFAFVFFYTFAGIPIARWADRSSRRTIIAVGLALWSAMTAVSGLAQNFLQLTLARVGVGVGEAAGSPPAHSLLSDYFPPERRATAMSIYASGVYIGSMIAILGGSYLKAYFSWRTAFLAVGLPGVLLALLVRFGVREMPRGHAEHGVRSEEADSFFEVLRFLISRPSFVYIVLGASIQSLSGYGVITWGYVFFERVHAMAPIEIGQRLGPIIGVAGTLGAFLGGRLTDALGARDVRWYMRLPALESVLGIPFVVGFLLVDDPTYSFLCFIPFYALGAMYVGPMFSMVQGLVRLRMRATAASILIFVVNMIGLGLGPLIVGVLNDAWDLRWGVNAIRYSMLVIGVLGGMASLFFWKASGHLHRDLEACDL